MPLVPLVLLLLLGPRPAHALEYVESSDGLSTPALDGGRTELELADVNGDGQLDILSIGDHGNPGIGTSEHGVMVWFGDGQGGWNVFQYGEFGYGGIAVGDVDGDGLLDIGYGMHHNYSGVDLGDQILEVARGDGTGRFWSAWDDGLATSGETWGMFGTDFADVDNDGDLDVGSVSFGCCAGVHVYLNHGDGSWSQSWGFVGGNSTMEFVFGDVDADGNPDFAVGHQMGTVYRGDGQGGFTLSDDGLPAAGTIGRAGPDLGDIDGDGADELSFVNSGGGVEVWRRGGDGLWALAANGLPATGSFESTQLRDMNGDGFADLSAFGGGTVIVWTGDGTGNWSQAASFIAGTGGDYAAFRVGGDADHNGLPDIALVGEEGSWPTYQNHLRFYKETSLPSALAARVVEPGGGEVLPAGSVRFLDWDAAVPGRFPARVTLDLSVSGPTGPWLPIASDLPNNGRFQWIVEAPGPSNDCYLRAQVVALTDSATAVSNRFRISFGQQSGVDPEFAGHAAPLTLDLRPNPSVSGCWIQADLGLPGPLTIEIHTVGGRRVLRRDIDASSEPIGFFWDGRDSRGARVPSGIYLVNARMKGHTTSRALAVLR